MRRLPILAVLTALLFSSEFDSFGQNDSLILLNGRSYTGTIGRTHGGIISMEVEKRKGKTKHFDFASYRVYSYEKLGEATTVYYQDELQGNFLSPTEARNATMGMYDARHVVKPRYAFWSSFVIGYGAMIFDTYRSENVYNELGELTQEKGFFKSNISIFPFFIPPVMSGVWAIPKFRVRPKKMIHKQFENDPHYYRGYHRISRQKRILYGLRGATLGVLSGTLTYFIFR